MQDDQLIKYCKQGKAKYQKMLLEKYSPQLMGVARRYMNNNDEAKDILQESWIKIFKALLSDNYTHTGKLGGWMNRVVINTALKSKSKQGAKIVSIENATESFSNSHSTKVIDKMTVDEVLKTIERLGYPSNEVFKLFIVDGFKHKEIAKMLGIAESTSRVHLTNARAKMKTYFPNFQELIHVK